MTSARWSRQNTLASVTRCVLATVLSLIGLSGPTVFLISVGFKESSPRKVIIVFASVDELFTESFARAMLRIHSASCFRKVSVLPSLCHDTRMKTA